MNDPFTTIMNGGARRDSIEAYFAAFAYSTKSISIPQPNEKETQMNFTNIVNLATRANKPQDEFVLDNLSSEIQSALAEAMADEKKSSAKAAAMEIMSLVKETREKEATLVEEIRAIRRKEVEIKVRLTKINEAKQFAQASSNYIPLALAIGHVVPNHFRTSNPELFVVPKKPEVMTVGE